MGFLGGSDGKESACSVEDLGLTPGLERSSEGGHGNPLKNSCLENPHGQRSLVGYSPRGHKQLEVTELGTAHTVCICQISDFCNIHYFLKLLSLSHIPYSF